MGGVATYEMSEGVFTVHSRTAKTVAFMRRNEEVAERAWEWVDMMVESMDTCMKAGEDAQKTSELLEYMRGMETRYKGQLETMRAEMETRQRTEAKETRDAIGAQVQEGMA